MCAFARLEASSIKKDDTPVTPDRIAFDYQQYTCPQKKVKGTQKKCAEISF